MVYLYAACVIVSNYPSKIYMLLTYIHESYIYSVYIDNVVKCMDENGAPVLTVKSSEFINMVKEKFVNASSPILYPFRWATANSIFPLHFGIKCCALEMAAAFASRFDAERFGVVARSSPRQSDLLIINGPVTLKVKDVIIKLHEQMPSPKYVMAMGECAISGGPYFQSYNVINGADKVIPVDIYVPGCPPRPEAMIEGILKLEEKIKKGGNLQ